MIRHIFDHHWRLLALEAGSGATLNGAIAAAVTWASFRPSMIQSAGGTGGYALDVVIASFAPAFMISLIAGWANRGKGAKGKLPALPKPVQAHGLHARWLHFMPARALLTALLVTLCMAPPLIAALAAVGPGRLDFADYLAFKSLHGAVVGAVCGPISLAWALIDGAAPSAGGSAGPASTGQGAGMPR